MLKVPFKLKDMVRVDEAPMHNAVREALVNCLVNADYYLSRGVLIDSYDDKIVMKNPGLSIVGKRQMLRGGDSEPRNANIMKMFNLLGFGEHAGSGVPDIFSIGEQAGYVEPNIEEFFGNTETNEPDKTVIMLPLVEKDQEILQKQPNKQPKKQPKTKKGTEIEERVSQVLAIIRENPTISRSAIATLLSISESQVRTAIENLRTNEVIKREGSLRNGKWIIIK